MANFKFLKIPAYVPYLTVFFGFVHTLPFWGTPPSQAVLLSAARSRSEFFGSPSIIDVANGWFWSINASMGLSVGQIILAFLLWFVFSALLLIGATWKVTDTEPTTFRKAIVAGTIILLTASCWTPISQLIALDRSTLALPLIAPTKEAELARQQKSGSVFANPTALPYLSLLAPGAVGPLTPAQSTELSANPPRWRQELRKSEWQSVALAGPVTEIRALLDHLLTSPDWNLVQISNQGYFFKRGGSETPLPNFDPATVKLPTTPSTAVYLAQIAERFDAVRRVNEGRESMALALELAPKNADVLSHAASLEAAHRRWQSALTYCDQALAIEPDNSFANLLKAVCLLETRQPAQAEVVARKVLQSAPNDPYTLFFYARICRTLNDYTTEAQTLERLVSLSKNSGSPVTSTYYVYLGQAYAKMGRPNEAIANYEQALKDPVLDKAFADELRASIKTIEEKRPR